MKGQIFRKLKNSQTYENMYTHTMIIIFDEPISLSIFLLFKRTLKSNECLHVSDITEKFQVILNNIWAQRFDIFLRIVHNNKKSIELINIVYCQTYLLEFLWICVKFVKHEQQEISNCNFFLQEKRWKYSSENHLFPRLTNIRPIIEHAHFLTCLGSFKNGLTLFEQP